VALDAAHNWLYVADTGNHLLRRVDLTARKVDTIAGTGQQSRTRSAGGDALSTALNSPWDLCLLHGKLYIAMAGPHQIWVYDPDKGTAEVLAGSGAEGRTDGPASKA